MATTGNVGFKVPVDTQTTLDMLENAPAEVYRRLRRETPVVRLAAINRIVFTKAEDVYRVKTDTVHFGSFDTTTPMQRAFCGHTLMRKDGPEHLRERRAMEPAVKPLVIDSDWRPGFAIIVAEVLDQMPNAGRIDLHGALASLIAARHLKLVLGLDSATDEQMIAWAQTLIQGAMNASFDPETFALCDAANEEMDECFDLMIEHHRRQPNSSVLSVMANAYNPLPLCQIGTNMRICLGGALVEARDALLTTIYGLLRSCDQLRYCQENATWRQACEEGLRCTISDPV